MGRLGLDGRGCVVGQTALSTKHRCLNLIIFRLHFRFFDAWWFFPSVLTYPSWMISRPVWIHFLKLPNMAPEVYQPLNPAKKQVRILRLAPGHFGRPIKGSLVIISLDKLRRRKWQEMRQWNALSYVWGTSSRDQILKLSRRSILITETLHCALQYLRHSHDARYY